MEKKKKPTAPKAPAKGVSVNPSKSRELEDKELKGVSGGRMRNEIPECKCSNMPSDPG